MLRFASMNAIALVLCGALALPRPATALTQDQTQLLIVMLNVVYVEKDSPDVSNVAGTGIIIGRQGDELFIATANHVVRESGRIPKSITAEFRWRNGSYPARLLPDHQDGDTSDLEVVAVTGLRSLAIPELPWSALASTSTLKPGEKLTSIGHPAGKSWFLRRQFHSLESIDGETVTFLGDVVEGDSGGVLVTVDWTIAA